ncbi:hypothetical protein MKW98_020460 [Papaver atlanticum]|uniref:Uncharacterized protein n=1 Tax=Papaver atlanticum TaxID=357466 RepID=A0AAD4RWN0_9MAGN|nr:hypothetical protein MKW98_020460 [Papaver atlanticum]
MEISPSPSLPPPSPSPPQPTPPTPQSYLSSLSLRQSPTTTPPSIPPQNPLIPSTILSFCHLFVNQIPKFDYKNHQEQRSFFFFVEDSDRDSILNEEFGYTSVMESKIEISVSQGLCGHTKRSKPKFITSNTKFEDCMLIFGEPGRRSSCGESCPTGRYNSRTEDGERQQQKIQRPGSTTTITASGTTEFNELFCGVLTGPRMGLLENSGNNRRYSDQIELLKLGKRQSGCYSVESSSRLEVNHVLLEEVGVINHVVINTELSISDKSITLVSDAGEDVEGMIINCTFSPVSHSSSTEKFPALRMWFLISSNYPLCSPVLLDCSHDSQSLHPSLARRRLGHVTFRNL